MLKYKPQLLQIFNKTLKHSSLDICLSALQACSSLLQIIDFKDTKDFIEILPAMVYVPLRALEMEDEPVLEEALVELNDIAESEPKFFRKHYKDIFACLLYTSPSPRDS